ncbi:hydroxymethylglutaryl-CoA lyase [Cryomorphaceae bacterium]|nr:hydroxymethylglutaryl-CoA lyase [Cryomorphaceae bacterium]
MSEKISIIDCPRDAMQGIKTFIPTDQKVDLLNAILQVGFPVVDFGSFVSPKAIPQMRDTAEVLNRLDLDRTSSELLAIVANVRGANDAASFAEISYLGYPFSISEEFQKRNTNRSIEESLHIVEEIQDIAFRHGKSLVVYLSMGFGNPYGETWSPELVIHWSERLEQMGIKTLALSDTIGSATPDIIDQLFRHLIPALPEVEFGAHLHTLPNEWRPKIDAAWNAGCRRFDGAIKGFGGCPMAKDDLTGNMPTEKLLSFATELKLDHGLNALAFESAYNQAVKTFPVE